MTKSLRTRLTDLKKDLAGVEIAMRKHANALPPDVIDRFHKAIASSACEHWIDLIDAREVAKMALTDMEKRVNEEGLVPYGPLSAKFQLARFLGVCSYLGTHWALTDSLMGFISRVLFTPNVGFSVKAPEIVTQLIKDKNRMSNVAGMVCDTIHLRYGWSLGISYALRNHFLHDGAQSTGDPFFKGTEVASGFQISDEGWRAISGKAENAYGAKPEQNGTGGSWPATTQVELRQVLNACEIDNDNALGILAGTASRSLLTYAGFLVGED